MSDQDVATISFHGEAHEQAAECYRKMEGWGADVETSDGRKFFGFIGPVFALDQEGHRYDGHYHATFYPAPVSGDEGFDVADIDLICEGDKERPIVLEIYDEIKSLIIA